MTDESAKQLVVVLERIMREAANKEDYESLEKLSKIYQRIKSVNQ